jgi:hypothetical protein
MSRGSGGQNCHREIAQSDDFEILEVTMPAEFETIMK